MNESGRVTLRVDGPHQVYTPDVAELERVRPSEGLRDLLDSITSAPSAEADKATDVVIQVDLRNVVKISSVGLNHLISIHRRANVQGLRMLVSNVQPSVRDIFALTRLERMFEESPEPAAQS